MTLNKKLSGNISNLSSYCYQSGLPTYQCYIYKIQMLPSSSDDNNINKYTIFILTQDALVDKLKEIQVLTKKPVLQISKHSSS